MMERLDPAAVLERSPGIRVKLRLTGFVANPVFLSLLLAVATLALYWPAIGFNFINYDDPDYFARSKRSHREWFSVGVWLKGV